MEIDIRTQFLRFFESKGHPIYGSMPLVPQDPSLLFTNAGMVQFKDIFTGKIHSPAIPRATSSQLCIRAGGKHNDLENVGYTARHHTLFEMLGNFSFGDYFKEEAIAYAWEFVTEILKLPKDRLYISVHQEDDEAFRIWNQYVDASKIKKMGDKDNFWQMGDTGPCGPCSEIFIDQGAENFRGDEDYFGGEGDRFLEIWNLVFMQYERHPDGSITPLPKPSIDTGMGLERVVALLEGKTNNFDSSIFMPLIEKVATLCAKPYVHQEGASYRVIADHARSVAFLLSQGVHFDKEGRGYVLRRILRRAVRHGYLLGIKEPFLHHIVGEVCQQMQGVYPDLIQQQGYLIEQCKNEEKRFFQTLELGMALFKKELEKTSGMFDGQVAFKLYDTYGFPLDLTMDMLKEHHLSVDLKAFESAMQHQKELAKSSWKGSGDEVYKGDLNLLHSQNQVSLSRENVLSCQSKVLALFDENYQGLSSLYQKEGWIMLDRTPFYAQGGGAVGDTGWLKDGEKILAEVKDTRLFFGKILSKILPLSPIHLKDELRADVDAKRQLEIRKHHSATHLLHFALREKLGNAVMQAGSLVESNRLRFDFTFSRALYDEELKAIQKRVNLLIAECIDSKIQEMDLKDAKDQGAIALFGEKYPERVRVVGFDQAGCELCGGLHIKNTGQIGHFYILKESSASSGIRRIEAVCGEAGYFYAQGKIASLQALQEEFKTQDLRSTFLKLQAQIKQLKKEAKSDLAIEFSPEKVRETSLIIAQAQANGKEIVDELKNRYESVAILLVLQEKDKISLISGVKNASIKAGVWVKKIAEILGGNGGGRDDFATAGGKDPSKIPFALQEARRYAKEVLEEQ